MCTLTECLPPFDTIRQIPERNLKKTLTPLVILSVLVTSSAFAASFDCKQTIRPDERAICSSRQLREMDVELTVRHEMLIGLVAMGTRGNMEDEQHDWMVSRAKCRSSQSCLRRSYEGRLRILEKEYQQLKSRGPF
jgi:uncharacterized protein